MDWWTRWQDVEGEDENKLKQRQEGDEKAEREINMSAVAVNEKGVEGWGQRRTARIDGLH